LKYPINIDNVKVPQRAYIRGDHLFNAVMDDPLLPKKTDVKDLPWTAPIRTWMVSCPPAWIKTGYTGNFYKLSDEDKPFTPRVEVLFGNYIHDHNSIHVVRGTQPFGSYLRGHTNSGRELPEMFPQRNYDFIDVQHYYNSDLVPGDFTEDQVYMTYFGLKVLLQEEFIKEEDPVLCFDKSWPIDKYLGEDVFLTPTIGDVIRLWEKTPYWEALRRWKRFAEWGKTYEDRSLALSFLKL